MITYDKFYEEKSLIKIKKINAVVVAISPIKMETLLYFGTPNKRKHPF